MDENKPSDADAGFNPEGGENVPAGNAEEATELQKINEATGKDFKTLADFQKHYTNLVGFSGTPEAQEIRAKAKKFDEIQTAENDKLTEAEKQQKVAAVKDERLDSLERNYLKSEFVRKNPDAESHFNLVEASADKQGLTLQEAWDKDVKDLATSQLAQDKAKAEEKNLSVESKPRISSDKAQTLSGLTDKVKQSDSFEDKQRLVEESLDLK